MRNSYLLGVLTKVRRQAKSITNTILIDFDPFGGAYFAIRKIGAVSERVFFVARKKNYRRQQMKTEKPLYTNEIETIRSTIAEKTGFYLKPYLIEQAFTRSSYSKRYGGGSNENLEYVGDTVLGYNVVKKLYEYYGTIHADDEDCYYTFRSHEKDFTELKSRIVSNKTLAAIIDEWDLCKFLIVGPSDIANRVDKQEKIKADLLEAIIGAITVQAKWDQEVLERVVARILPIEEMVLQYEKERYREPKFSADNAVSTLKEMAEREECDFPEYRITGPEYLGYTESNAPRWSCSVTVSCWGISIVVFAHSKKDAKKYAAYLALCTRFELPNEYGPSKRLSIWGFDGEKLIPNPQIAF